MIDINTDDFYEVMIPAVESGEWFCWVECDDEDDAEEAAIEKHEELSRPDVFEDFDSGLFPCAYQAVIDDNRNEAIIIHANWQTFTYMNFTKLVEQLLTLSAKCFSEFSLESERKLTKKLIGEILRKYCDQKPVDFVSLKAKKVADKLGIDLFEKNWHDQNKFDPGRKTFHLEHKTTIHDIAMDIIDGKDVLNTISKIQHGWILKSEDKKLNASGKRKVRKNHNAAYYEAGIDIIYRSS